MRSEKLIVVVAGPGPGRPRLEREVAVVAADGGVDHALEMGLTVDVAVGDFDSVSAAGLAAAIDSGARVVRFPAKKDATDLELALDEAASLAPERVLVIGSPGGRLDHLFGALLILGSERYARFELDAHFGSATAHVVRSERRLSGEIGELISLFALHGVAEGVTAEGLVYPLRGEPLEPGSGRGVSNAFAAPTARIAVESGVLIAVRPGGETTAS